MMWRRHAVMSVEEQLALDETVARALQYYEEQLAATSSSETDVTETIESVVQEASAAQTSDSPTNESNRQDDIDPDAMTYEELQSLGDAIGAESQGLSDDVISLLPCSIYSSCQDECEECVICCATYIDRETLITLPCKHRYHSHCGAQWLRIKKVCPVCNIEVFSS